MNHIKHIAKHFKEVYFGGNWTTVNYKDILSDVNWKQATTKVYSFNTIATLVFHTNYYVSAVTKVLEGESLNAKDEYSFDCAPINSEEDWQALLHKNFSDAEKFTSLIESLSEEKIFSDFDSGKYGNYYRNLNGIIEHCHYHLGQITLIKKMVQINND